MFAGCGAIVAERAVRRRARRRRRQPRLRADHHGDGLRDRAPVRRAHQPGRHDRLHAHPPLPGSRRRRLHRGAARRRDRAARSLLLAVWPDQPAELGATVPSVGAGQRVRLRARADRVPDVRDHGRRHRHARRRRRRGDRDRRHRRPRRALRRPGHGRVDEPGALVRARARGRRVERLLDLRGRPGRRRGARRVRLPARARRGQPTEVVSARRDAVAVITDIHANLPALEAVARSASTSSASSASTAAATWSATARIRTRSAADRGARHPDDLRQLRLRDRARPRGLRLRVPDPARARARPAVGRLDARAHRPAHQGLHARAALRPALRRRARQPSTSCTARRARSTSTCSRTSPRRLYERLARGRGGGHARLRAHPQAVGARVRRGPVRQLRLGRASRRTATRAPVSQSSGRPTRASR